jgi:hypothetical protein
MNELINKEINIEEWMHLFDLVLFPKINFFIIILNIIKHPNRNNLSLNSDI